MSKASQGSHVEVHYIGSLEDGTVFDSSSQGDPIPFVIGEGKLIPNFENAIIGMQQGETKSLTIPSDQAYGPYREDMIVNIEKSEIPDGVEVGNVLQSIIQGQEVYFTVIGVDHDRVTLDANHPLAGKDLNFEITLVKVA